MKNLKVYEENLKKKAGVIVLSLALGTSAGTMTGCSKDKGEYQNKVTYTVEDANIDHKVILDYPAGVDRVADIKDDVVIEKYVDYNNIDSEREGIDYVYTLREAHLTSKELFNGKGKAMTAATFSHDNNIMIPNCYKWAESYFGEGFIKPISDINYNIYELKGLDGNYYIDYEYNIKFKKDINLPGGVSYLYDREPYITYGDQEPIKKDDELNYKALYKVNYNQEANKIEFVTLADQFTGMGEDSENIKNEVKNNYSSAYKDISTLGMKESKEFSNILDMEFDLYENHNSKVRK